MGDIHDLINEIYNEQKCSSTDTLLFRACQSLLRSARLCYLNFCLMFFPILLYVWSGAPEASKFSILSKTFQNYAPLVTFSK